MRYYVVWLNGELFRAKDAAYIKWTGLRADVRGTNIVICNGAHIMMFINHIYVEIDQVLIGAFRDFEEP